MAHSFSSLLVTALLLSPVAGTSEAHADESTSDTVTAGNPASAQSISPSLDQVEPDAGSETDPGNGSAQNPQPASEACDDGQDCGLAALPPCQGDDCDEPEGGECGEGEDCELATDVACIEGEDCEVALVEDCEGDACEEDRSGSWIVVPIVGLSPETDFSFGLGYLHYFFLGDPRQTRLSASRLAAQYSLKRQLQVRWVPLLYFPGNEYQMRIEVGFNDFPNSYWGVGSSTPDSNEESYQSRSWLGRVDLDRQVSEQLYVGGIYEVESYEIISSAEDGLVETAPGHQGGLISGVGVSLTREARDNTYAAMRGQAQRLTITNFGEWIGSDYNFTRLDLDTRHYAAVAGEHVFAAQAELNFNVGGPPFERLALVGGDDMLRGYFEGRFRDNHLIALQGEYRTPFLWRLGLVVFFGVGWAFGQEPFSLAETKFAGGAGVRFAFDREERIHIRFDYGVGPGTQGYYIGFGEAF